MLVDFYLPQQSISQLKAGDAIEVTTDAYPGRIFTGQVSSFDAKVDSASRMLQVRATVPNADGALLPGMYLNVSAVSGPAQSLVTIPLAAVAFNSYGSLVTSCAMRRTIRAAFGMWCSSSSLRQATPAATR
jgi:membrane fusion protein, multidrug efflux system